MDDSATTAVECRPVIYCKLLMAVVTGACLIRRLRQRAAG